MYDEAGNYRGKLSANPYDPESVSNPYGRYGSEHSADSINNKYRTDSPGLWRGDEDRGGRAGGGRR